MFKFFPLVLILAMLSALEADRIEIVEADKKCQVKFDITSKELDDFYNDLPNGTDGIDRKFKCYTKCMMDELNFKDENGKIDFKRIVDEKSYHRGTPHAIQVTAECETKHDLETDECERTFKIIACITLALKPKHEQH